MSNSLSHREKTMRRNAEMQKNTIIIDYSEYNNYIEPRRKLPKYILYKIRECISEIKERYPYIEKIYLIGSYSNGSYIDENTEEKFKELKKSVYKRVKISDFDFETEPPLFDIWISKSGHKIHLWKDRENNKIDFTNYLV